MQQFMKRSGPGQVWRSLAGALLLILAAAVGSPSSAATQGAASAPPAQASPAGGKAATKKPPPKPVKRIDINSAGRAELKTLPYIDDAAATRLIAARPFLTKKELVTKEVIPLGPYLSIKDRVIALQKTKPKPQPKP